MNRADSVKRNSGAQWIGDVPAHWSIAKLREDSRLRAGESPLYADEEHGGVAVIGANGPIGWTERTNANRGLAIGRVGSCGSVRRIEEPVWLSDNVLLIEPKLGVWDEAFLFHVLTQARLPELASQTAQPLLTQTALSRVPLPRPPVVEQRLIGALLDRETGRIDALMEKKRLLIERLEEYRTALITRTVTRGLPPEAARAAGLDPSPRLKPSGVEWLGDVPEHWETSRLARVISCLDGRRIPLNAEQRGDFQGEFPYWGANRVLDHVAGWLFDEPLVLLGEDGAPFFDANKRVAFSVSGKIWVNNHAHVLRPTGIHPEFLTHVLNITEFAFFIDGSTRDKLTQGQMNSIPVPLPPLYEQLEISMFLHQEAGKIDSLVERVETNIERLEEHRTALITAAVTGKIDVREDAPAQVAAIWA